MTVEGIYSLARRVQNLFRYGSYWHPVRIGIEVVSSCNRRCHYCVSTHTSAAPVTVLQWHDRMFQIFLRRLNEHRWNGMVTFNGFGEPLLHPDLPGIVRAVKHTRPKSKPAVYTNGDRLTVQRTEDLIQAGTWKIIVTRHSPFTVFWDARMIEIMQAFPQYVIVRTIQLEQLVNFGGRLNMTAMPRKTCRIPSEGIIVYQNGDVTFCCCAPKDIPAYIAGNIAKQSFRQIWDNPAFARMRRQAAIGVLADPLCKACMSGKPSDNKA